MYCLHSRRLKIRHPMIDEYVQQVAPVPATWEEAEYSSTKPKSPEKDGIVVVVPALGPVLLNKTLTIMTSE